MTIVIIMLCLVGIVAIVGITVAVYVLRSAWHYSKMEGVVMAFLVLVAAFLVALMLCLPVHEYYVGSVRELKLFEVKRAELSDIDPSTPSSSELLNKRLEANLWLAEMKLRRERLGDFGYIRSEIMDIEPIK